MLTKTHSIEGGTFITNFHNHQYHKYLRAIILSGIKDTFVSPEAYDCNGKRVNNLYSFHVINASDLSNFWEEFDKIPD